MNKKRIKKRYIILAIIATVIIALVIVKKNQPTDYLEHVVETGRVSDELRLAGVIDAARRADLSFAASGRVEKILAKEGQVVKEGQILAELSQNRTYADLSQAQASLRRTQLDNENDIGDSLGNYNVLKQEQDLLVERAYQNYLAGDLVAYNVNTNIVAATAPIISGSYVSTEEGVYDLDVYASSADSGYSFRLAGLDTGTYTAQVAQAAALGTKGLLIQFSDQVNYKNTDWRVEIPNTRSASFNERKLAYESALATRDRVLESARASRDRLSAQDVSGVTRESLLGKEARSRVNAVAAQINDGRIRAPFDGVLAKNFLEVGEVANAFDLAMVMLSGNDRLLTLNTPEIYINKIKEGAEVDIVLDAYDDEIFNGIIQNIDLLSTEVDGVPVYRTEVLLTDNDERIRVGMNAKAEIVTKERNSVVRVPAYYVEEGLVQKKTEKGPLEVSVEIGLKGNDGFVEILEGLVVGDIILSEKK